MLALKGSDDVVHQTLREKGRGGGRGSECRAGLFYAEASRKKHGKEGGAERRNDKLDAWSECRQPKQRSNHAPERDLPVSSFVH